MPRTALFQAVAKYNPELSVREVYDLLVAVLARRAVATLEERQV